MSKPKNVSVQLPLPGCPTRWRGKELFGTSIAGIAVDALGDVYTCRRIKGTWIKLRQHQGLRKGHSSYARVGIRVSKKKKTIEVHRLVADAVFGPLPWGYETHHIDNNNSNNRIDNLVYLTIDHHDRTRRGEELSEEDWEDII